MHDDKCYQQQWTHHAPRCDPTTSVIANGTASARNNDSTTEHCCMVGLDTIIHYSTLFYTMHTKCTTYSTSTSTLEYPTMSRLLLYFATKHCIKAKRNCFDMRPARDPRWIQTSFGTQRQHGRDVLHHVLTYCCTRGHTTDSTAHAGAFC